MEGWRTPLTASTSPGGTEELTGHFLWPWWPSQEPRTPSPGIKTNDLKSTKTSEKRLKLMWPNNIGFFQELKVFPFFFFFNVFISFPFLLQHQENNLKIWNEIKVLFKLSHCRTSLHISVNSWWRLPVMTKTCPRTAWLGWQSQGETQNSKPRTLLGTWG